MSADARRLGGAHAPDVARTLALAFQDDPVMSWVVPDPDERRRILPGGYFLVLNRFWVPDGEIYAPEGDVAGAACWMPPHRWHMPMRRQLGMLPSVLRLSGRSAPRYLRVQARVERSHPREPEHWYLAMLGVRPDCQGCGLGSKLMFPVLSRCDERGERAYLEASTPRNVALYERHGFEVVEQLEMPGDCPPVWRMWREPQ